MDAACLTETQAQHFELPEDGELMPIVLTHWQEGGTEYSEVVVPRMH